ncbi:conserved hypothetical protein [Hyella patelloides LEGE 07179]|uniref:Type IV pilus assembly protein PilO n=1 Tax=Hyella patelloides LEGE 07179 TaxID=945734 RepID=A0A563VJ13_9CYAN|nr:type II and III secretion system protein [Hyella patelloides]VEP11371.1 conserved hypothetical protein [Hyella patelloides LEGE 07179]
MTFADDFLEEQGLEDDNPTVFGITFTPMIIGIVVGVAGLVGAGYIYMNMASEARTKYQGVKSQLDEKQAQIDQMKQVDFPQKMAQMKADIAEQKALKSRVTAMFTSQEDLETLLIDLNSFISANQGELVKYSPDSQISVINDSSLGSDVNGKLKRKGFSLDITATYNQTLAILQDIERLQPLLMIQNYSSKVSEKPTAILTSNQNEIIPQNAAILTTSLKIDAILPRSQQELEAAQKAEEQAQKEDQK